MEEVVTPSGNGEVDQPNERKISRIFTMLQTVQSSVNLLTSAAPEIKPSMMTTASPAVFNRSDTNLSFFQPPLRNPMKDRFVRLDTCSSWTGSECSQSSIPPPLVHSVPYHKDGPLVSSFMSLSILYFVGVLVIYFFISCMHSFFSKYCKIQISVASYYDIFTHLV